MQSKRKREIELTNNPDGARLEIQDFIDAGHRGWNAILLTIIEREILE